MIETSLHFRTDLPTASQLRARNHLVLSVLVVDALDEHTSVDDSGSIDLLLAMVKEVRVYEYESKLEVDWFMLLYMMSEIYCDKSIKHVEKVN